jgi:hypothetical protein
MRTKQMIVGIVLAIVVVALVVAAALMVWLGPWLGLGITAAAAVTILLLYILVIAPWQHRWGATDQEVTRTLPGDDIAVPHLGSVTRAITIAAPPEQVWPWLVQIGLDRAGWYSYDWIDNDGRPSADRIIPEFQDLHVGQMITMMPGYGPRMRSFDPGRYLLAGDAEDGTWCLALEPVEEGTRLISRWRLNRTITPANAFFMLLSDPGAFIMERKMLKGIKARAERTATGKENGFRAHRKDPVA